jgi:polyhydroxybutyrate depolymerase
VKAPVVGLLLVPLLLGTVGCRWRDRTNSDSQTVTPTSGYTIGAHLTTADGRERTYRLYVPGDLPEGPVPLLIALHGGVGSAAQFERTSGFDALADEHGFLVVYPDGVGVGPTDALRTWNGGYCCGRAARDQVDDVAFVRRLIDTLEAEYAIDPLRVFAAGHSNGGIMSYRLACELSERIVAVGLQSGSLGIDGCRPDHPVSLLHIHGNADTNHPIDGGYGTTSISGVDFRSARTSVSDFAAADGCPAQAVVATDATNRDLTVSTWSPCADGTAVRFIEVDGAGHPWMGHHSEAPRMTGDAYMGIDAGAVVVEFLLAHPRRG